MRPLITVLLIGVTPVLAQNRGLIAPQRVSPAMMYHRVWAVTPLVGSPNKPDDPVRPMFIAAPPAAGVKTQTPIGHSGLIGFQMQLSDDHKSALVEYVFATPAAFQTALQKEAAGRGIAVGLAAKPVSAPGLAAGSAAQAALEAAVPGLKIFERGKATDNDILTEFRKHKANFTFGLATVRPR